MGTMNNKFSPKIKSFLRFLAAGFLVLALVFSHSDIALAARSGGRIGGSQFRSRPAPSRTYTAPNRGYYPGPTYPGGGFGFPFLIPFFGVGGGFGGLFTILIFIAIANFLVSAVRRANEGGDLSPEAGYPNPPVSLNKLQVGLLAEARYLQPELNQLATSADTGTATGLNLVLQETTLALLRHPEYWVYANAESQQSRLTAAEAEFNRLALSERSHLSAETLSNVNQQVRQAEPRSLPDASEHQLLAQGPGEYILVTLLVAAQGKLNLPKVNSAEELRQALKLLGAVSSDQLLALEVLWTPQAEGDTLTSEELITAYPDLKLI